MSDDPKPEEIALVVGIGASAGGLEALREFFEEVPSASGIAFVVVQHLDPTHGSMLAEILDRDCELKVTEAEHGGRLEPNCVYTIPPDAYLELRDDTIQVVEPKERRGFRTAIDHLFRSMAGAYGENAVGVVLSGAGSDGAAGLQVIKSAGGLTLAQNPESAQYSSMPQSAICTGTVDRVMEAKDMVAFIAHYSGRLRHKVDPDDGVQDPVVAEVAELLSETEDFDLQPYKDTTVGRRICRRMCLAGVSETDQYLEMLREDGEERNGLIKDLLINVTDFLRDAPAFETLETEVIPKILEDASERGEIRIWVAGCATGEEAYTLAILFHECLQGRQDNLDFKIFATDVDPEAIRVARAGIYPASVLNVFPPAQRARYFREERGDMFRVTSVLRDRISFARQNLFADPPFSRMDLISCRNVLIYLRPHTQDRILRSFGFALRPNGFLFLGSSETVGDLGSIFREISAKWRLYQRHPEYRGNPTHQDGDREQMARLPHEMETRKRRRSKDADVSPVQEILLQQLDPSIVIDGENRILYLHGDLGDFLRVPQGEPVLDLMSTLHADLKSRVRGAVFKARRSGEEVGVSPPREFVEEFPKRDRVAIRVAPAEHPEASEGTLVIRFAPLNKKGTPVEVTQSATEREGVVDSLEHELAETREELRNATEELETSSEELKRAHEEALSTNEELQSANEELEASTEELRSLNEELTTVNAQLKEKIDQLQSSNDYQQNLFASSNIATVFLNRDLEVGKITPAAGRLLNLGPHDIGRPVAGIAHELIDEQAISDAAEVMATLDSSQRDIRTDDGRWFTRKILPFKTEDQRIDGVVMTYFEITQLKRAMRLLEASESRHSLLAKLGVDALGGRSVEVLQHEIVREIAHVMNCELTKILRYEPAEKRLRLMAGVGWDEGLVGEALVGDDRSTQAGYTLAERGAVIVSDISEEKRFRGADLLREHGVVSGISCVIGHPDNPYGVLSAHSREQRTFTQEEGTFLTSVANLLSVAVHREDAADQVERSRERLDMARAAARIGIHDHDLKSNRLVWDPVIRDIWGVHEDLEPITYEIFKEGLHPDDRESTLRRIAQAAEDPEAGDLRTEYRVINRRTGETHWVEATGNTVFEVGEAVRIVGTVQDITGRKEAMLKLEANEQKLRMARDSSRMGSFEYCHYRERTGWDPLLKELWGLKPGEAATQNVFWEGVHPEDRESVGNALDAAVDPAGDGHYQAVYRVVNRIDGRQFWVEASGQTIFTNGKPDRMIGMVIDVTGKKELEDSLQVAVDELKAADEAKNRFLATLGHELRNPLMVVSMGISVLERDPSKLKPTLDSIRTSSSLIASLLDDLLDLTRITRGKLRLSMEPLDLNRLLVDHVEGFRSKADTKKLTLQYEELDEPAYVRADANRLGQILANLLTNAFKFSPEGGEIEVVLERADGRIRVSITDSGVGLAEEDIEKIFDPFEQVGTGQSGNTGLGIGLSLVRELTEKHGGTVQASSGGPGKGATFTLEFPEWTGKLPSEETGNHETLQLKQDLAVLIVDDNRKAASGLSSILEAEGCRVVQCDSAESALESLENFRPEAMLIDIGLGDMDGCDLLKEIVARNGNGAVPIAITGYGHEEARQRTTNAGFAHHLTKPPDLAQLLEILSKAG